MIYQFEFRSDKHNYWLNNLCKVGDIIYFSDEEYTTERWRWWRVIDYDGEAINITIDVNIWLKKNDINYPFNEEEETLFILTFG